jgi:hypothetical protein
MILDGGCLCGAVRYRVTEAPYHATICHCSLCRKASGAPVVTWFAVKRRGFAILTGVPSRFRSSDHGTRQFCGRCGTPLIFESTRYPEEIDVTTASLHDAEQVPPQSQIYTNSSLTWSPAMMALPVWRP